MTRHPRARAQTPAAATRSRPSPAPRALSSTMSPAISAWSAVSKMRGRLTGSALDAAADLRDEQAVIGVIGDFGEAAQASSGVIG